MHAQGDDNATKGHTLYRKQEVVHNWGEPPEGPTEENITSTEA